MADVRRLVSLGTALLAAGTMLFGPHPAQKPAPPRNARLAWPQAQRAALPATLADGTGYEPAIFLDANRSVGTALTPDHRTLRLLLRRADGTVRVLRAQPISRNPSFASPALDGQVLVWSESGKDGNQLWTADLATTRPARRLTTDLGDARFYQSQYDLVIADGRVHWVAAGPGDTTEVRSIALAGGPVDVRSEAGSWALSAWPWLADGVTAAAGTTRLRNLTTGEEKAVAATGRGVTACTPLWCRRVSFDKNGYPQIEMMRPGGQDRRQIADGTAATVITDAAVLDRFEVFSQQTDNSDLSGHIQLLAYDLTTRSTVEISPDATDVGYRAGVLWWSSGNQDDFVRHTLDLRTVTAG